MSPACAFKVLLIIKNIAIYCVATKGLALSTSAMKSTIEHIIRVENKITSTPFIAFIRLFKKLFIWTKNILLNIVNNSSNSLNL